MAAMTVRQLPFPHQTPSARRLHVVAASQPLPEPMHPAERRMRDAGGPDDRACYACGCGLFFVAPVSTSVHCPRCNAGQAW